MENILDNENELPKDIEYRFGGQLSKVYCNFFNYRISP